MPKIDYYINFSSQIIGFFKKDYIEPFTVMKNYISENYSLMIKNETKQVHFVVTFISNSIMCVGVEKKPRYFNKNNNCDYNIVITIPSKQNTPWGHRFRPSETLNDFDPSLDKNLLFTLVDVSNYTSMSNYLQYCGEEIIMLMETNKLIKKS